MAFVRDLGGQPDWGGWAPTQRFTTSSRSDPHYYTPQAAPDYWTLPGDRAWKTRWDLRYAPNAGQSYEITSPMHWGYDSHQGWTGTPGNSPDIWKQNRPTAIRPNLTTGRTASSYDRHKRISSRGDSPAVAAGREVIDWDAYGRDPIYSPWLEESGKGQFDTLQDIYDAEDWIAGGPSRRQADSGDDEATLNAARLAKEKAERWKRENAAKNEAFNQKYRAVEKQAEPAKETGWVEPWNRPNWGYDDVVITAPREKQKYQPIGVGSGQRDYIYMPTEKEVRREAATKEAEKFPRWQDEPTPGTRFMENYTRTRPVMDKPSELQGDPKFVTTPKYKRWQDQKIPEERQAVILPVPGPRDREKEAVILPVPGPRDGKSDRRYWGSRIGHTGAGTADWMDSDGDKVDDRYQAGPGAPRWRVKAEAAAKAPSDDRERPLTERAMKIRKMKEATNRMGRATDGSNRRSTFSKIVSSPVDLLHMRYGNERQ
jgi:hypothetical protein